MAALESEHLGGAADVAVVFVELFEDVVAFVGVASLVQRGEIALGHTPAAVAVDQWGQVLTLKARGCGIHDHDALNHVAQFAYISRPGVAHQHFDRVVGDFARPASVGGSELLQKIARQQRDIFFAFPQRWHEEGNHVEAIKQIFPEIAS